MRRGLGRHNRRSAGGPLASLSLNFLTSTTLDPRITFSRASSASYTNAAGKLASAANNAPRFDYSPTSIGTPMGFLVEGQATNVAPYSQDPSNNAAWSKIAATVTSAQTTGPDGNLSGWKVAEDTSLNYHYISNGLTVAATTQYAHGFVVKAGTASWIQMTGNVPSTAWANFNLTTGAVGLSSGCTPYIASLGGGWYYITLVATTVTGGTAPMSLLFTNNTNTASRAGGAAYTGTGQYIYFWNYQCEAGAFSTTPITTTSAAATRAVDILYLTAPSIGTQGTMVITASVEGTGLTQVLASTAAGKYLAYVTSGGNVAITDGTNTATSVGTVTPGVVFKASVSWGPAGLAVSLNRATPVTNASYSGGFNNSTAIQMGQSGSGANSLFGHLQTQALYAAQYVGPKLQGF